MTKDYVFRLNVQDLARDYFAEYEIDAEGNSTNKTNSQRSSRASSLIDGVATWSPEQGWALILMLLELAPSSGDVIQVGCGPLHDFVWEHGPEFADRIAAEAGTSSRLRDALRGVWAWDRLPAAVRDRLLPFLPSEDRDHWVKLAEARGGIETTESGAPDAPRTT